MNALTTVPTVPAAPLAGPPATAIDAPAGVPHQGMPPLDQRGAPLSFFEFWPMWAFYPPVALYAAWLMLRYRGVMLPTAANPSFPGGGFYGESKAQILDLAVRHAPAWVAPFVAVDRPTLEAQAAGGRSVDDELRDALATARRAGLDLPLVAKPDLGCRGAGVKLVRTAGDLRAYLQAFPLGARLILQRYVAHEGEAGIFYCRLPGQARGRIVSITLKYFPYVHGDGRRTLRELILADPRAGRLPQLYLHRHAARLDSVPAAGSAIRLAFAGSHSRGAIFRDGTQFVTAAMEARFDAIAQSLPEFHFGRFDVRFADFEAVRRGGDFTIVEVNGAGAESTHIWDRRTSLWKAWGDLMRQYRWLFRIGRANVDRGFAPMRIAEFRAAYRREKALTPLYPPTD
jgi:hypothetical protein